MWYRYFRDGFVTTYAYTTDSSANQITTITQGSQTRVSKTDSLGRTSSMKTILERNACGPTTPEQWLRSLPRFPGGDDYAATIVKATATQDFLHFAGLEQDTTPLTMSSTTTPSSAATPSVRGAGFRRIRTTAPTI